MGLFEWTNKSPQIPDTSSNIPAGLLRQLKVSDIKPSSDNPRQLFDPEPLSELRASIKQHGVLVPITVYQPKGQSKYTILDGERRYRCCLELQKEGKVVPIPANVVAPPDKKAALLYMFSIHSFREEWELMPTALGLKEVMGILEKTDNKSLSQLTGLSVTQIERCKWLLEFPDKFQKMSLEEDPAKRIPSNFWIELYPVWQLYRDQLPELYEDLGKDNFIQRFVDKYWDKKIISVIHFRRIREGITNVRDKPERLKQFKGRMALYINDPTLETRKAFDEFLITRDMRTAASACEEFISKIKSLKLEYIVDEKEEMMKMLKGVQVYISNLLQKMEGDDPPEDQQLDLPINK